MARGSTWRCAALGGPGASQRTARGTSTAAPMRLGLVAAVSSKQRAARPPMLPSSPRGNRGWACPIIGCAQGAAEFRARGVEGWQVRVAAAALSETTSAELRACKAPPRGAGCPRRGDHVDPSCPAAALHRTFYAPCAHAGTESKLRDPPTQHSRLPLTPRLRHPRNGLII